MLKKLASVKNFALAIGLWGGFFLYLWLHLVRETPEGLHVGAAYMWGDWALHYIISSVAAYRPLSCWFTNHPVFLNHPFDYPFVVDFISGLLLRSGFSIGDSFLLPTIVMMMAFLIAIYLFSLTLTASGSRSFIILSLLLLNGGMGFVNVVLDWFSTPDYWQRFPEHLYSHWPERGFHFGNMTITEFLPQRAFLLGLPITLFIVSRLLRAGQSEVGLKPYGSIALGLLAGSLLFVHPHSYLFIVFFSIFLVCRYPNKVKTWLLYAAGAGVPSGIWWSFMHHQSAGGFFQWHPGWIAYEPENGQLGFVWFWFLNWGLFLPLAIIGSLRYKLYRQPVVLFGFILFFICNLIKFQPWSWDNTKLFTYSYLFLAIPVAHVLTELLSKRKVHFKIAASLLFLSLTLSGAIDLFGIIKRSDPGFMMYSKEDMELAAEVRKQTDPCDIILTSTDHHHWLPALTGRQILMGYAGWVASYGIDFGTREKDLRTMYQGGPVALDLMKQYGVKYALIGPKEIADFVPNQQYFDEQFSKVFSLNGTRLYRVAAPSISGTTPQ